MLENRADLPLAAIRPGLRFLRLRRTVLAMLGRPLVPDDPFWKRGVHLVWTVSLWVFCGYLSYWISDPILAFLIGLWPEPPPLGPFVPGEPHLWAQFWRLVRALLDMANRVFWIGWFVILLVLSLVVYKPLEFAWQWIGSGRGSGSGVGVRWKRLKGFLLEWGPVWLIVAWVLTNEEAVTYGAVVSSGWVENFFEYVGLSEFLPVIVMVMVWVFLLIGLGALLWFNDRRLWRLLGRITGPVRTWWRQRGFGAGGSAEFGGLFDEISVLFRRGDMLLGASLYFSRFRGKMLKIGMHDDRHMLTIAGPRGGKGRSAIIPNLIVWPHSALVIDPKGTNAAVTAARRGKGGGRVKWYLGQEVFVVDPFEIVEGVKRCAFNPLAGLDVNALTFMEDIGLLADALVVPETGDNQWFSDGARTIVSGVVTHLLMQEHEKTPTLLDVRRALLGSADEVDAMLGAMMERESTGGGLLTRAAASLLDTAGPNARGGLFNTVAGNLRWLDSAPMAAVLDHSDFDIADLKNGNTTVYVVLPPYLLEEHKRFMRMFINLAIREMSKTPKSKTPVLFLLDEFFSLGPLSSLEKAAGLLAGDKVKLWPILQNLGQIKELYPRSWEGFFAASGFVQIFAIGDLETLEFVMAILGKTKEEVEVDGRLQRVINQLLEPAEIGQVVARERGIQIIRRLGGPPLLLRRTNYDSTFWKWQYSPDPDHEGS